MVAGDDRVAEAPVQPSIAPIDQLDALGELGIGQPGAVTKKLPERLIREQAVHELAGGATGVQGAAS